MTAHLADESRQAGLPELSPTLVRWAPPAAGTGGPELAGPHPGVPGPRPPARPACAAAGRGQRQESRLSTIVGRSMTWSARSGRTAVPIAKNSVVCDPQA
jgi:hypothetical protein